MRQALLLATMLATASCAADTEPLEGNAALEMLAEKVSALEAKVAFLDQCAEGDVLVRDASGWRCTKDPACPPGFAATTESLPTGAITVCTRAFRGASDVMVRVGDFWIDRYEVTECPGPPAGSLGMESANDATAAACSKAGAPPRASFTWFEAAAMCANAGKHLCSNAEWQAAVSGTPDPGAWPGTAESCSAAAPVAGQCNTCSNGPRPTGQSHECQSRFGAEDMIGNVWEWTADWYVAGIPWSPVMTEGGTATPWPPGRGYGDGLDITSNTGGRAGNGVAFTNGIPAAGIRGGNYNNGPGAGAFALSLDGGPSSSGVSLGGRCCAGGR